MVEQSGSVEVALTIFMHYPGLLADRKHQFNPEQITEQCGFASVESFSVAL
jgi:hypothetical protein